MNAIQKEAARSGPGGVYGHRKHCRRGCPALAEGSVKGTAGTPGLGPTGFSQAALDGEWGDRGKTVKIAPEGQGEEWREDGI